MTELKSRLFESAATANGKPNSDLATTSVAADLRVVGPTLHEMCMRIKYSLELERNARTGPDASTDSG